MSPYPSVVIATAAEINRRTVERAKAGEQVHALSLRAMRAAVAKLAAASLSEPTA